MSEHGARAMEGEAHWKFFNWPNIISEARMRHEQAAQSTASAITPEMRTLEFWSAWCAHANVAACLAAAGDRTAVPHDQREPEPLNDATGPHGERG